jgi:hypothetical protein
MDAPDAFRAHVRLEEIKQRIAGHTASLHNDVSMLVALANEAPSWELLDVMESLRQYSMRLEGRLQMHHERFSDQLGGDVAFMNEEVD